MKSFLKSILLVLATVALTYSFLDEEKSLIEIFTDKYHQNFNELVVSVNKFEKTLESKKTTKIQKEYLYLRSDYKALEPFLIYFDPDIVKKDLNGAPLLKLEENSPGINVLQPKGLQVIDELMGEEVLDLVALQKNIKGIAQKLKLLKTTLNPSAITHRKVIELYQLNLVKILTLEQSGFDTPGTLNGLEDSKTTFKTINQLLFPFLQQFPKIQSDIDHLRELMQKGEDQLNKATNFNDFNRAQFLSEIVEPLYAQINKVHLKSGVEYYDEVSRFPRAQNTRSNHIFSDNFLNSTFYSGVDPTDEGLVELGKILFYDPVLSGNNKRACASCHNPQKGFTDNKKASFAFDFKGVLDRNSPTLFNAVYATDYFWDLRAQEIRHQIEHVVFSPKEFATGFNTIEGKLRQSEAYISLFSKEFGHKDASVINKNSIEMAITAYVQSLNAWNSDFDKYARGEENNLSNEAIQGFNLFMGKGQCGICHFPPSFSGLVPPYFTESESEVLGMITSFDTINPVLDEDLGRAASSKIKDRASFYKNSIKTPTVRNVEITFPYMHNGGFKTLEEVIHFYNKGGGQGLGLKVENQTLPSGRLNLTKAEMSNLKSFLISLTDTSSVNLSKPKSLPTFGNELDRRVIGGEY